MEYVDGKVTVHHGDCQDVLAGMAENSVDSVVTDPPYELGFMNKQWDNQGVAFRPELWAAVLRVLKPGGHLLALGGSRTYHRMACAVEDAGFEIRDQIMWLYGTGFPKSRNVSKAILDECEDAAHVAERWKGWGSALKPSHEPVIVARKPLVGTIADNVIRHGTGGLNIDACRVDGPKGWCDTKQYNSENFFNGQAKKTIDNSTNPSKHLGRWPANVIHDGSDEVEEAFAVFGELRARGNITAKRTKGSAIWGNADNVENGWPGDTGTASRFFYCAKASKSERCGSKHPTVKPLALMQYLVRLVTPPNGTVLDPFAGTGTTAEAAIREGMRAVLIEREPQYQRDIAERMAIAADEASEAHL